MSEKNVLDEKLTYSDENKIIIEYIKENILTYHMTSDELFEKNMVEDKKYDFIFIDGDHREFQVTKDIKNALEHLNTNGYVMLHDTLPPFKEAGMDERLYPTWMGTVWKSVIKLNSLYEGLEYHTIDTDCGCCLIRKTNGFKIKKEYISSDFDYDIVFGNETIRNSIFNVITTEEFKRLLELGEL